MHVEYPQPHKHTHTPIRACLVCGRRIGCHQRDAFIQHCAHTDFGEKHKFIGNYLKRMPENSDNSILMKKNPKT